MNSYGRPLEKVKYSAYGVAMEMTNLDYNADGVINGDDLADFIGAPYDWDLDGDVDSADSTAFGNDYFAYASAIGGRGTLSLSTIGNRKGYAGYEFDGLVERYHVRHRVYVPEMGRWTRRDPIGYVDGVGLYEYVGATALIANDPSGLIAVAGELTYCDDPAYCYNIRQNRLIKSLLGITGCIIDRHFINPIVVVACAIICLPSLPVGGLLLYLACILGCEFANLIIGSALDWIIGNPSCFKQYTIKRDEANFSYCACTHERCVVDPHHRK